MNDDREAFEVAYRSVYGQEPTREEHGPHYRFTARLAWQIWCQARSLYATTREPVRAVDAKEGIGTPCEVWTRDNAAALLFVAESLTSPGYSTLPAGVRIHVTVGKVRESQVPS